MNKVFFLVLFACCRDSYVEKQITGEQGQDYDAEGNTIAKQGKSRASDGT
jgi:hypothetical protein